MKAALPENEVERLRALPLYQILDTLPEQVFDEITQLAAHICGCPIATISIIAEHRQWYKSRVGMDMDETPRDIAFCAHTIQENKPLIVEDATLDERFADNPVVTSGPNVRFYAGMPLTNKDGLALGTLCVVDLKPRHLSEEQTLALGALSRHVVTHLELRRALIERTQAEAEVQRLNQSLERRVEERTEQLNTAFESLKVANQAKSEFLTNMSHEIRTPLNAITGMTDLMRGTELNAEQKDFIETIHANGENLLTIVNDVLDFSKIEFGKLELDLGVFNLRDLLNDINSMFRFRATKKNLKFITFLEEGLPVNYMGDAGRIRQVLINLVSNAIKFTESGGIELRAVDATPKSEVDSAMRRLFFGVGDTGIGIASDRIDRLFKVFSQVDASTTRRYGGSGLGLAISQKLVELMSGSITVESKLGQGSTFSFEIPLRLVPTPTDNGEAKSSTQQSPEILKPTPARSLNILLVEDNLTNQKVVKHILQRLGHVADVAHNGREAVSAVKIKKYDLIFMDIHMPEMDGFEATRQLRQNESKEHRPRIVALTADVLKGEREKCLTIGMDDYVTKPIKIEILKKIIDNLPVSNQ